MSAARTPKVGEVWRSPTGTGRTVTAVGETYVLYRTEQGGEVCDTIDGFVQAYRPPVTPVPDFMPAEVWVAAHGDGHGSLAYLSAEAALAWSSVLGAVRYVRDDKTGMVTR